MSHPRSPTPPTLLLLLLIAACGVPASLWAQRDEVMVQVPAEYVAAADLKPLESDLFESPPARVRLIGVRFRPERLLEGREALRIEGIRLYDRNAERTVYEPAEVAERPKRWMRRDFVISVNDAAEESRGAGQHYLLFQTPTRGPWESPISAIVPPQGGVIDLDPTGFKGRGSRFIIAQPIGSDEEFPSSRPTAEDLTTIAANLTLESPVLSAGLCRLLFSLPLYRLPPARLQPLRKRLASFETIEHRSAEDGFHQEAHTYDVDLWILGARLASADPAALDELMASGVPISSRDDAVADGGRRPPRPLHDPLAALAGGPHPDPRIAGAAAWVLYTDEGGFRKLELAPALDRGLADGTYQLPGDEAKQQMRRSLIQTEAARSAITLPLSVFLITLAGLATVVFGGRFVGRRLTLP